MLNQRNQTQNPPPKLDLKPPNHRSERPNPNPRSETHQQNLTIWNLQTQTSINQQPPSKRVPLKKENLRKVEESLVSQKNLQINWVNPLMGQEIWRILVLSWDLQGWIVVQKCFKVLDGLQGLLISKIWLLHV